MIIRPPVSTDITTMLEIYTPIVLNTATSFELEPPSLTTFEERVNKYSHGWAWLVAEENGQLLGYAYGSPHRERKAYQWSTETSVYVHESARGRGIGKKLYEALLTALQEKGYCNAYAGIAMPNDASVALHRSVGFSDIGRFPRVGYKFDAWHDVAWFHKELRSAPPL
jgi:phosphinothricin acetyltransferase